MAKAKSSSPMMEQFRSIRGELPRDTLLMFRLGDFYEMFFEDAQEGASILNVALTKRGTTPMCGIPYHAASNYISKILQAGKKVALCDQVEEARPGKLVKRAVTQILSPGTHFDEKLLLSESHNYLAGLFISQKKYGLAYVDLTTGDFKTTTLRSEQEVLTELERIQPSEIVVPMGQSELKNILESHASNISEYEDWVFEQDTASFTLRDHFKVKSLDGFGLKGKNAASGAAGGILHYLIHQLRRNVEHLTRLSCYEPSEFLVLDAVTLRHLEILEPAYRNNAAGVSLFGAVNRTVTPMGARRLKEWLACPLAEYEAICQRQMAVHAWLQLPMKLDAFRQSLKPIRDMERTMSRLSMGAGNARDLNILKVGLESVPALKVIVDEIHTYTGSNEPQLNIEDTKDSEATPTLLDELKSQLNDLPELIHLIESAIVDEPSAVLNEGNLIRSGFNPELDEIHCAKRDGKAWIAKFQAEEIEKTDIPSLKVRFNSVFGYFIEITRTHLEKVPEHYVRKQTIANGERFITEALKQVEGKILGAEERATKLEYDLFLSVR